MIYLGNEENGDFPHLSCVCPFRFFVEAHIEITKLQQHASGSELGLFNRVLIPTTVK